MENHITKLVVIWIEFGNGQNRRKGNGMSYFRTGEIIYNEFHIDFSITFLEQIENLLEDLLQIKYAENIILDVGWYPEYDENGYLFVQVILDGKWDAPVYKSKSNNKVDFEADLLDAICIAEKMKDILKKADR